LRVRVSDLAQFASCGKRSKLQGLRRIDKVNTSKVMYKGRKMHFRYSYPYKSFERRHLLYLLKHKFEGHCFIRRLDDIEVRGIPDDYRVLFYCNRLRQIIDKVVSIIEVKTTSKKRLWLNEVDVAVLQLQIYIWLMQPYFERLGYKMHSRHYVEIYSQKDDHLIKRILVKVLPDPEREIKYIVDSWRGLNPLTYPKDWICKKCPKSVKRKCSKWISLNSLPKLLA